MTFTIFHAIECLVERMVLQPRTPISVCIYLPKSECIRVSKVLHHLKVSPFAAEINVLYFTPEDDESFLGAHCCSAEFDLIVSHVDKENLPLPIAICRQANTTYLQVGVI
jgi:hypothetical protein